MVADFSCVLFNICVCHNSKYKRLPKSSVYIFNNIKDTICTNRNVKAQTRTSNNRRTDQNKYYLLNAGATIY